MSRSWVSWRVRWGYSSFTTWVRVSSPTQAGSTASATDGAGSTTAQTVQFTIEPDTDGDGLTDGEEEACGNDEP